MPPSDTATADVCVVGFGFAGLATLAQVVRHHAARRVTVVASDERGLGVAYATEDPTHLLNVRTERMGAWADRHGDFARWLGTDGGIGACRALGVAVPEAADFAPRALYAHYLTGLRERTLAAASASGIAVRFVRGEAIALRRGTLGWTIEVAMTVRRGDGSDHPVAVPAGETVRARTCVLAVGHEARVSLAGAAVLRGAAGVWRAHPTTGTATREPTAALEGAAGVDGTAVDQTAAVGAAGVDATAPTDIGGERRPAAAMDPGAPGAPAVIAGTGLSAVDALLSLRGTGFAGEVVLVSRHGLLPQPHCTPHRPYGFTADRLDGLRCAADVRALVAETTAAGRDWRLALEGLRPHTQRIWRQFPPAAQREVVEHWGAVWSAHRHRLAPAVAARIEAERAAGSCRVVAGQIRLASPTEADEGRATPRAELPVHATGPLRHDGRPHVDRAGGRARRAVGSRETVATSRPDGDPTTVAGRAGDPTVGWRHGDAITVARRDGGRETLRPALLVDCTGANLDWHRSRRPLLRGLLADGHCTPHHTGLGVRADGEHRIGPDLFAVGTTLTGELWESVAVPELREQAAVVAGAIAAPASNRRAAA